MKQTSIEWLEMEIVKLETRFAIPHKIYELCEQAKQMHKQEMNDIYDHAFDYGVKSAKIELPSDEEIIDNAPDASHLPMVEFIAGAKWMREQILKQQK